MKVAETVKVPRNVISGGVSSIEDIKKGERS